MTKLSESQMRELGKAYQGAMRQAKADVDLLTDSEVWERFDSDVRPHSHFSFAPGQKEVSIQDARILLADFIAMDNAHLELGIR